MTIMQSNRAGRLLSCLGIALLCAPLAFAQTTDPEPTETSVTPLDDITTREVVRDHRPLEYAPVREADILWEKRIWRVVDVREKINQPFIAWEAPLFKILRDAALSGALTVYNTDSDQFKTPLSKEDVRSMLYKTDTVFVWQPEDPTQESLQVVENETNWEDVKRFRIKEAWYFDAKTASLRVRILGIAPLIEVRDSEGNFRFEKPLFWVHYPTARPFLAAQKAITHSDNFSAVLSWEDLLERRQFSGTIMKENNLHNRRIEDYATGIDGLLESKRIESDLFAREHDLWSW